MSADATYLQQAKNSYRFICDAFIKDEQLKRNYKNGQTTITAYLEDYALVINSFINFFEVSAEEEALIKAAKLTTYVLKNFYDSSEKLFFFTDENGEQLIARKKELFDNVIPSSNAVMAENLHWLGILVQNNEWLSISDAMVHQLKDVLPNEPKYLSKWLQVYMLKAYHTYEIVIAGEEAHTLQQTIWKKGLPNCMVLSKPNNATLAIFKHKEAITEKSTIYVCQAHACRQPVLTIEEAIAQIKL